MKMSTTVEEYINHLNTLEVEKQLLEIDSTIKQKSDDYNYLINNNSSHDLIERKSNLLKVLRSLRSSIMENVLQYYEPISMYKKSKWVSIKIKTPYMKGCYWIKKEYVEDLEASDEEYIQPIHSSEKSSDYKAFLRNTIPTDDGVFD